VRVKKWALFTALALLLVLGSCGLPLLGIIARSAAPAGGAPEAVEGIPPLLLEAYQHAADRTGDLFPQCTGMEWHILAGIGAVESNHLNAGHGYRIAGTGDVDPPFYGPRLDSSLAGTSTILDTDNGGLDGDTEYDRAIGPMQFIPSSWRIFAQDGNGDGEADPNNVFDAALAAAAHLCGDEPRDLSDRAQLRAALHGYNNSSAYVDDVLARSDAYAALPAGGGRSGAGKSAIIEAGEDWLGTPYLFGGACNTLGRDRCDCSSLARYAYRHGAGIELPRTTYEQVVLPRHDERFTAIPAEDVDALRPGDLLFFGANPPSGIYHVGLYISKTQMLEAPRTGLDVRVYEPWQQRQSYYGAVGLR
jgi:cell wall-associated NlpC family hydrolase